MVVLGARISVLDAVHVLQVAVLHVLYVVDVHQHARDVLDHARDVIIHAHKGVKDVQRVAVEHALLVVLANALEEVLINPLQLLTVVFRVLAHVADVQALHRQTVVTGALEHVCLHVQVSVTSRALELVIRNAVVVVHIHAHRPLVAHQQDAVIHVEVVVLQHVLKIVARAV